MSFANSSLQTLWLERFACLVHTERYEKLSHENNPQQNINVLKIFPSGATEALDNFLKDSNPIDTVRHCSDESIAKMEAATATTRTVATQTKGNFDCNIAVHCLLPDFNFLKLIHPGRGLNFALKSHSVEMRKFRGEYFTAETYSKKKENLKIFFESFCV